jgi:penicillin amidase
MDPSLEEVAMNPANPVRCSRPCARALLGILTVALLGASCRPRTTLPGLEQPVDLLTDDLGIVHVYARNDHDAFFAQGYVHARDRFFQMDANRRAASGTLAELTGSFDDLEADAAARLIGLRQAAQRSLDLMDAREAALAQAYADGVNAWLASNPLPPEYEQLELTSVPAWTVIDTLAMAKGAAPWTIDLGQLDETAALASYVQALGEEGGTALYRDDLGRFAPWVPRATVPDALGAGEPLASTTRSRVKSRASASAIASAPLAGRAREWLADSPFARREPLRGSNAWGVAAEWSENGRPLVASDGHDALTVPARDYEIHLMVRDDPAAGPLDVIGQSVPGIPGAVGWNGRVAFGWTAGYSDFSDIFRDRLLRGDPACPARLCIDSAGALHPVEEQTERYRLNVVGDGVPDLLANVTGVVSAQAPEAVNVLRVPFRSFGPVLEVTDRSILANGPAAETTVLTLQYAGLHGTHDARALFAILRARDVFEFHAGFAGFTVPNGGNVVAADVDGNLLYFAAGEVPLRADLEAGAVVGAPPYHVRDGSGPSNWIPDPARSQGQTLPFRVIPQAEMPQVLNPPAGFVVNCNEDPSGFVLDNDLLNQTRPSNPGAILYLGDRGSRGLRNGRVTELLRESIASGRKLTVEDMKRIQGDTHAMHAEILTPHLLDAFAAAQRADAPPELAALAADPRVAEAVARFAPWDFSTPTGIAEGYDASDVDGVLDPDVSEAEAAHSVATTIYMEWFGRLLARVDASVEPLGVSALRPAYALVWLLAQEPFTGVGASGVDFFPLPAGLPAADRRDFLLLDALRDALDALASPAYAEAFAGSTDQDDYRWGRLNRLVLEHRLGADLSIPPAAGFPSLAEDLPGLPRSGAFDTVNPASAPGLREGGSNAFAHSFGAVSRAVSSPIRDGEVLRWSALSGGPSGDPASPRYAARLGSWLTADSQPVATSLPEILFRNEAWERFHPEP